MSGLERFGPLPFPAVRRLGRYITTSPDKIVTTPYPPMQGNLPHVNLSCYTTRPKSLLSLARMLGCLEGKVEMIDTTISLLGCTEVLSASHQNEKSGAVLVHVGCSPPLTDWWSLCNLLTYQPG
jgi:hypothetical protein